MEHVQLGIDGFRSFSDRMFRRKFRFDGLARDEGFIAVDDQLLQLLFYEAAKVSLCIN